ncbi:MULTISPECIES: type 1 glutamine amidotransferase [unclassified Haladaptatus]|uniref:type 1 glutamine amidotransferase n=1 Tax=unclassified Haladaptatus TaxID=2622732 RepID=UPI00209BF0E1|nr:MULTISPECIES: type 1 glutamine amidotransferase [unclassified Haladaptatus]MCO8242739.1 type 1 glutamine amidotransferase [Haladaptatus sp. AB643]MCO8252498.1 type 1 glutamine amidotransferase [Haladaptatus sp. AB618]
MSRLRIAFLNAAHGDTNTRRNFRRELDADLVEFDATERHLPDSFDFDAAVISGSRASVYWDEDWISPLKSWVDDAIETGMPMLGICYGHQLLADVLGGDVRDMGEYEIGYRIVEHTGESVLFEGIDREFTAFTTHSDEVAELPPGATSIAENEYSNHGFRKGDVFGLQFHPEYDTDTAEEVTRGKDLAEERLQKVLDGINEENFTAACETKLVFENFTEYVRDVQEPAAD